MAWSEKSGKNTWRVRFERDDGTLGFLSGFTDEAAAIEVAERLNREATMRGYIPTASSQSFGGWIDPWFGSLDVADSTRAQYLSLTRNHIAPRWGSVPFNAISNIDAHTWATKLRNSGLAVLILLIVLLAWFKGRKRAKERTEAASYVVEQLRQEALERAATQVAVEPSAAMLALESMEKSESNEIREELAALVERQPEDVAALLRGWLARCGCALLNEVEATSLSGRRDPVNAARDLHATMRAGAILVVKCGADGALAIRPDGAVARAAAPRVAVVDTIGAGDVFNAAFLAALAEGAPLAGCLEAGTQVASRAISTSPRSYGSLPQGAYDEHA